MQGNRRGIKNYSEMGMLLDLLHHHLLCTETCIPSSPASQKNTIIKFVTTMFVLLTLVFQQQTVKTVMSSLKQAPSTPKDCDDKMNVPLILVTLFVEGVPVFSGRVMKIHVVRKF